MTRANPATTHQYAGIAAWNVKLRATIHSYDDAKAFLGDSRSEKLGSNMYVIASGPSDDPYRTIDVVLYRTTILRYRNDGKFWADNGGWNTPTTTTRLNMLGPEGWFFGHERGKLTARGIHMRIGEWHEVDL